MNSLNLRQTDGGNIIKQADSGSMFRFELLDENYKKFEEQLSDTATVILKQGTVAVFKKIVAVTDNCIAFNLDKILEVGDYTLEIIVGDYVFPSNNCLKISVESTYGDYQPENLVRMTYEEIDEKINVLKDRIDDVNVAGQSEMLKRIETLEQREDKDTIYDDSDIKRRLTALEQKEDHDTIYNDTEIKQSVADVDTKVDNLSEKVTELEKRPIVDTALTKRVEALEDKPDNDTIYDDSNLKAQIVELQEKLKSLNTVRRAPTGYTLDRTTTPWRVLFDNGCELRFPKNSPTSERDKANLIYGYGFPANNNSTVAFSAPIPPLIISASRGAFTVDKFKESDEAHFHVTYADYRLYYPIRKSDDFNWENAYGDRVNQTVSTNGKSNFAKLMYELGIWSEADVLYLGATKK